MQTAVFENRNWKIRTNESMTMQLQGFSQVLALAAMFKYRAEQLVVILQRFSNIDTAAESQENDDSRMIHSFNHHWQHQHHVAEGKNQWNLGLKSM
jgi:hypothetical protein